MIQKTYTERNLINTKSHVMRKENKRKTKNSFDFMVFLKTKRGKNLRNEETPKKKQIKENKLQNCIKKNKKNYKKPKLQVSY